jgi:predicted TIM-barrel fold metal-dependent hydrolase
MASRRDFLIGATASGAIMLAGRLRPARGAALSQPTPVSFAVPKGACDCHTHIFGDPHHFPLAADRAYTPQPASTTDLRAMHRSLGIDKVVIVQPSVYGTDNSCTLAAIEQIGHSARGIAVIDPHTSDAALDQMHRNLIRGVRLNLETAGEFDPAVAKQRVLATINRIKGPRGWHLQIYTHPSVIEAIQPEVASSPVRVVFDHFGGAQASLGVHQPGFRALLNLVKSGKAYVKLSAPYRSSTLAPDYPDVAPLARALLAANPTRCLWASDWPHPQQIAGRSAREVTPPYTVDDAHLLNLFAKWAPGESMRKTILVENPAHLYGF